MTEYIVNYLCVSAGVSLGIVTQQAVFSDYVLRRWWDAVDIVFTSLAWPLVFYAVPTCMIMNWRRSRHKCDACGAVFRGGWSEARATGWHIATWDDGEPSISCPECDFHNEPEPRER